MRPIDADAFIERFSHTPMVQEALKIAMDKMPTIEPKRKKGHWIGGDGSYICSECNSSPMDFIETMGLSFDAYVETPMNYCPNCGADMR